MLTGTFRTLSTWQKCPKDAAWGGEPEIRAFENLHDCVVVVVQAKLDGGVEIVRKHSNTNVEAADDSASMENRLRVCVLYSGESHYDALVPMAETVDRDRERSTTFDDSMDATAITHDKSFSISYDGAHTRLVPRSVTRDASCLMRSLASLHWNDERAPRGHATRPRANNSVRRRQRCGNCRHDKRDDSRR